MGSGVEWLIRHGGGSSSDSSGGGSSNCDGV